MEDYSKIKSLENSSVLSEKESLENSSALLKKNILENSSALLEKDSLENSAVLSEKESLKSEQKSNFEEYDFSNEDIYEESPINEKVVLLERKNGFRMGTDSVLLSKFVNILRNEKGVDLGTGSGVIPLLLLSENKGKHIHGIEIQKSLYSLAVHNAKRNGFENSFTPINGDIRHIKNLYPMESADFVTLNPPYFKKGSGKESEVGEKLIARHEMNGIIDDFCHAASYCLKFGGKFFAVFRADRLIELICAMKNNNIEPKHIEFIYKKGNAETVLIQGTKGAKSGLIVTGKESALVRSK